VPTDALLALCPTLPSDPLEQLEYYAVCGKGNGCGEGNEEVALASDLHEVRCCRDDAASGFNTYKCDNVWTASDLGGCHVEKTHAEAEGICQDYDSRLCTKNELSDKCTKGSGCSLDGSLIWSSTPATSDPISPSPSSAPSDPIFQTYYVVCGKGIGCPEGNKDLAFVSELHEVRCCRDEYAIGFETNRCDNVWAASDLGGCHDEKTYVEAEEICQDYGSRLCTMDELSDKCTKGSGCGIDSQLIWSSTPVASPVSLTPSSAPVSSSPTDEPEYYVVCGKGTGCSSGNENVALASELHEVRCCKDEYAFGFETNRCASVWAASDLGGCHDEMTYVGAEGICQNYDSRLCTRDEISDKCTKGSGCGIDNQLIWSSTLVM